MRCKLNIPYIRRCRPHAAGPAAGLTCHSLTGKSPFAGVGTDQPRATGMDGRLVVRALGGNKEDAAFSGSASSGGEKMRRTRLASEVILPILSQHAAPSKPSLCIDGFFLPHLTTHRRTGDAQTVFRQDHFARCRFGASDGCKSHQGDACAPALKMPGVGIPARMT
jgi:hypothetical protein